MLDHLAQPVQLLRGQAALLHPYLLHVQERLLLRDPRRQRFTSAEALSLKPLAGLIKRVARYRLRDQRPAPKKPRPHQLTVPYDEMTTLRLYYGALLASAAHDEYAHAGLATVLMQFHQPSLSLEQYVKLPPATGPASQTSLL